MYLSFRLRALQGDVLVARIRWRGEPGDSALAKLRPQTPKLVDQRERPNVSWLPFARASAALRPNSLLKNLDIVRLNETEGSYSLSCS